jgi:hypothetical protein
LVLVVRGTAGDAKKLQDLYHLNSPIFDGTALWSAIAGRSTPLVVVVDELGQIRWRGPGWGGEFPDLIHKELEEILRRKP